MPLDIDRTDITRTSDKEPVVSGVRLYPEIARYIDENYAMEDVLLESSCNIAEDAAFDYPRNLMEKARQVCEESTFVPEKSERRSLEDVLGQLDESFSKKLLRLIDERGLSDAAAYKQANIDRRVFSMIRKNDGYKPSKSTAIAFAVALRLNPDEMRDLLGTAGYSLSHSSKADIIIEYFILHGEYDINQINTVLFEFHQPLLGG